VDSLLVVPEEETWVLMMEASWTVAAETVETV
jgi:hypothetical protein